MSAVESQVTCGLQLFGQVNIKENIRVSCWRWIHQRLVDSFHKRPVMWKMLPGLYVVMTLSLHSQKTPHVSPSRVRYGLSLWGIWRKSTTCYNNTKLYIAELYAKQCYTDQCYNEIPFIWVNSLTPRRYGSNFGSKIFQLNIQSLGICCDIALRSTLQNLTNEKLSLVQVMAWCHQATSHHLSQCLPTTTCVCQHMASLSHNDLSYVCCQSSHWGFEICWTEFSFKEFQTWFMKNNFLHWK